MDGSEFQEIYRSLESMREDCEKQINDLRTEFEEKITLLQDQIDRQDNKIDEIFPETN